MDKITAIDNKCKVFYIDKTGVNCKVYIIDASYNLIEQSAHYVHIIGVEIALKWLGYKEIDKEEFEGLKQMLPILRAGYIECNSSTYAEINDLVYSNRLDVVDNIPLACRSCKNHPSNGGSGICHCILGLPQIT